MVVYVYDGSFEGLLTALFEVYAQKKFPDMIVERGEIVPIFGDEVVEVGPNGCKADRVWKGLKKRLSRYALWSITACWMSGLPDRAILLLRYMKIVFDSPSCIELDFGNAVVLEVARISKKMARERERVVQFARFQQGKDDVYYALMEPRYDVLPFTVNYFADRYAFQKWMVFDIKRGYGYYYDNNEVIEVNSGEKPDGLLAPDRMTQEERLFQKLWCEYFNTVAIQERINPKLHKRNLPVRFWKYLTEKQR